MVTEPAATYRDVGEEPARADDADGESPDAEGVPRGCRPKRRRRRRRRAVAELLDSESDPAFAFRPSGVARPAFRGVLYGNYASYVGDDETLGDSSSFEVEREVERVGEARDAGRNRLLVRNALDDVDDSS